MQCQLMATGRSSQAHPTGRNMWVGDDRHVKSIVSRQCLVGKTPYLGQQHAWLFVRRVTKRRYFCATDSPATAKASPWLMRWAQPCAGQDAGMYPVDRLVTTTWPRHDLQNVWPHPSSGAASGEPRQISHMEVAGSTRSIGTTTASLGSGTVCAMAETPSGVRWRRSSCEPSCERARVPVGRGAVAAPFPSSRSAHAENAIVGRALFCDAPWI